MFTMPTRRTILIFLTVNFATINFSLGDFNPENCEKNTYPTNNDVGDLSWRPVEIPTFTVDLDKSPQERWVDVMTDKFTEVSSLIETIQKYIGPELYFLAKHLSGYIHSSLPSPYKEEIEGIAKVSGLTIDDVTFFNIFYEVYTVCTSIITINSNNTINHVRNLDFGLFMGWNDTNKSWEVTELLKPTIVKLEFKKNDVVIYKAVGYAGYVGIVTGMKPGKFALTINERFNIVGGYYGLIKWMFGYRQAAWMGFLTRQVMEDCESYNEALKSLYKTKLLAPVYFILSGIKEDEGAIVTRSLKSARMKILGADGLWYLVQTNYDFWKQPPFYDDRRTPAKICLNNTGKANVSFATLYDVLSTKPIRNKLTTYSALMETESGKMEIYIRDCFDPDCPPWMKIQN